MKLYRTITEPSGAARVDFMQHVDGSFSVRVWERDRKRLRIVKRPVELRYALYPIAVYRVAQELDWLGNAFHTESGDWRHGYHLELLRGHAFRFAEYLNPDDSDHCVVGLGSRCGKDRKFCIEATSRDTPRSTPIDGSVRSVSAT